MFEGLKKKFSELNEKYEKQLELVFFIGGFVFDALMVSEVDDLFAIVQQFVYLIVIAFMIHYEILFRMNQWKPSGRMIKMWEYRNLLLHFLLGTLLNIYSLFYIKSASLLNSIIFLVLMLGFIIANELPVVKKSHMSFKVGLYGICLFSFLAIIFPLMMGFIGWVPFCLSVVCTLGIFYFQFKQLQKNLPDHRTLFRAILAPCFSVLFVFTLFYFLGLIPPVPLSAKEQGVYHMVEKKDGEYILSTERPWWKFWQSGDQDFMAEPGDKIYFYVQIFSPAHFSEQVSVQWSWLGAKGDWLVQDRIPLKIVGGRKEGYRGYTTKNNYQPGSWKVQVLTANGQEISRLYFDVTSVATKNQVRQFTLLKR